MSEIAERCGLCGEVLDGRGDGDAEMYDPRDGDAESLIVHASCGLSRGWDVA